MSNVDVVRLIAEALGVSVFVGGGVWYGVRQTWRVLTAVNEVKDETRELKEHQQKMNGSMGEHTIVDDARFEGISQRLSHIEGRLSMPLGSDINERKV